MRTSCVTAPVGAIPESKGGTAAPQARCNS